MNYIQFLVFILYCGSVLISGISICAFLDKSNGSFLNRSVYLGESFLLGGILVIGEMLILSLVKLYSVQYLWGCVLINYLFLLNSNVRRNIRDQFFTSKIFSIPMIILSILISIFIFRNYYFLITGDSHNVYLYAQKLWLMKKTSIVGDIGNNVGIFAPHFNAVPYALGISLFGQEVLFPQLVNISWRAVVLLLVFGYTSYRFNGYYGLIAAMLVLFDEHFFYSGINVCVVINAAVIAFLFASIYNFWESRTSNNPFRFLLAVIFLSQLMGNKYQFVIVTFFTAVIGFAIQPLLFEKISKLCSNKKSVIVLAGAIFVTSLWYVKNYLVTGCPTFPILADKIGAFNWTPEMVDNFSKVFGGVSLNMFFKYLTYFYVWPGIIPAKILIVGMILLPFILLIAGFRNSVNNNSVAELGFWFGVSFLGLAGVCFVGYTDPRIYRYVIAVLAFSSVFMIEYVLSNCFKFKKSFVMGIGSIILFILMFAGCILLRKTIPCSMPTVRDNINVILNRAHMDSAIAKYYPKNIVALKSFYENEDKSNKAAWDIGPGGANPLSAFLLPVRSQVGLWCTSIVKWNSYEKQDLIVNDLKSYGLEWVMNSDGSSLEYQSLTTYAEKLMQQNRYPQQKYYNYSFPKELSDIHW